VNNGSHHHAIIFQRYIKDKRQETKNKDKRSDRKCTK